MEHYGIPVYNNCSEFLYYIGTKYGKLLSGGVPNKKASAKIVLQDWNSGKVPFYVEPPKIESETSLEIVDEAGEGLDINKDDNGILDEISKLTNVYYNILFRIKNIWFYPQQMIWKKIKYVLY